MKLQKRTVISITLINGEAEEALKGYEALKVPHKEIYLKGLRVLKREKK